MKKAKFLFFAGLLLFILGIYVSTLLLTHWVAIGTSLAMVGGFLMGGNAYFCHNLKRSINVPNFNRKVRVSQKNLAFPICEKTRVFL